MSASVGQKLRQERSAKELTLEKVARDTRIRMRYLLAIEAGDLEALPSAAQARGFIRTYARYLGLPSEPLMAALRGDKPPTPGRVPASSPSPQLESQNEPAAALAGFTEVGAKLRSHRELLGFTLSEVEKQTHLRLSYLQAMETGDFSVLPSPVQGRGMLKNYAEFLGLDSGPLLLKFAEGLQADLASRHPRTPGTPQAQVLNPPGFFRRLISGDLIFGGFLVLALLVFVIATAIRVTSLQTAQVATSAAPSIVDVLLPTATPTANRTPPLTPVQTAATAAATESLSPENTPTPEAPLQAGEDPVQVQLVIRQRAWLQVTVDGKVELEGRVIPGSAYFFSGRDSVEVVTSSGSALQIIFNQEDLGPLGIFGEVVRRVFTPQGILLPTPTVTPTPTATAPVTVTPTATETPIPLP